MFKNLIVRLIRKSFYSDYLQAEHLVMVSLIVPSDYLRDIFKTRVVGPARQNHVLEYVVVPRDETVLISLPDFIVLVFETLIQSEMDGAREAQFEKCAILHFGLNELQTAL